MGTKIIVPWHNHNQLDSFLQAWNVTPEDQRLLLVQDHDRSGCARTKNRGILQAMKAGVETVIILDDDCYPNEGYCMDRFISEHEQALMPQKGHWFKRVTEPPSRGTPYFLDEQMPVAASMGFWDGIGDYDACSQLVVGCRTEMSFKQETIFGRYFPLCGMNLAFHPVDWWPWCQFVDVPRFDDIWMGWLWQKEAYRRGNCFNLNGPVIRHIRQSNVWANLRDEAKHLEDNEILWQAIATSKTYDYDELKDLFPL